MAGHAQLKFVMTECSKTQIRLTGLILLIFQHIYVEFNFHKMFSVKAKSSVCSGNLKHELQFLALVGIVILVITKLTNSYVILKNILSDSSILESKNMQLLPSIL